MKNLYYKLMAGLTMAYMEVSEAVAGNISVTDFRNTSGAAGKDLNTVLQKQQQTGQSVLDFVFMAFTIIGVIICGICIIVLYKASKDPDGRDKPMGAIVGLFAGGALTTLGLIAGYFANTVTA